MKVSEINIREKEYYLSTIEEYCSQIENHPGESDSIECLFNILRDMGYLLMYGSEPDSKLLNRVKKLFSVINENTAIFSPSFIDFISLEIEAEWYKKLWLNHKDFIKDPPTLKEDPRIEEAWEKVFNYMKQRGLELITAGLDIFAVFYSNQVLFKDIRSSDGWQKSWKIFLEKSDIFINTLFNIEEKYFYHVSDSVYKMMCKYGEIKEIIPQPAANFLNFIRSISKPGKSYAADSAYRIIISPEEAEEIYFNISCNYNDDSQGLSKVYLYECALAEKVIKQFIIKRCLSEKASDKTNLLPISDWKLLSSSDDDFYSALPMVKAGNKEYPVCVIPPRLKGFSIRNDLLGSSLNGVLFCSFKKYPSDEILVRFDNYIGKERVFKLLRNTDAVKGVQNVTKLSFDDVYKFDKRDKFLQEAAEAVMGLQAQSETNPIEIQETIKQKSQALKRILINATNRFKQITDDLFSGTQRADDYDLALAAGGDDSDEDDDERCIEFKKTVEIDIANPGDWIGLFSSFSNAIRNDFKRLVHPENGLFCYAAIVVYKNHKIELINIANLPEQPENTTVKKELSKNNDCLSIYLGITNKSNKDAFSKIIDEYKDALEKNKELKSENLKIIRWIKFNFKFNQTE